MQKRINMVLHQAQVHHLSLREQLCVLQKTCPGCGIPSSIGHTRHHLFIRRIKKYDHLLWTVENISLICAECHVDMGEAPRLGYLATMQKFEIGIAPERIEAWVDSLPMKIKRLPGFYWEAKEDFLWSIK